MKKADNEKKDAKAYSLLVVPSSTLAIELGKARKRRKDNKEVLEKLTRLLDLSEKEIHQMERGNLEGIDHVNARLKMYFNYIDMTMSNLYKKDECTVLIPNSKGKLLGTKTYLMAIDTYTTQFNNRDELLDDIRKNGYLDISNYTNDELWIFIERPRRDNLYRMDLIYRDNEELVNFIAGNEYYHYAFDFSNPYVKKIDESMKSALRSKRVNDGVEAEFKRFVQKHPELYRDFMYAQNWDKKYDDVNLGVSSRYIVIRAYCVAYEKYKKEKENIERRDIIPFNERAEESYRSSRSESRITDSMHIFDTAFRSKIKLEKKSKKDINPNQLQMDFGEDNGFTR